ncbi:hypothetical protein GCM10010358_33070 [Streptomyces minutiscleroticus]|uniref:histidine kinase n=1 Tax=Streptomyces minutiscleroticus TaxID=68238 RepID=A0A918KTR8_9ACTN|nr:substrate-binding domain-containing protein [Streptomyces minutiscleroticus]GGX76052.1 hypothetical protein GCM10010358_33070 [Streptomyces minutiscleroticus]
MATDAPAGTGGQQYGPARPLTVGLLTANIHLGVGATLWSGACAAAERNDVSLVCFPGGPLRHGDVPRSALYDLVGPARLDGVVCWSSTLGLPASGARAQRLLRQLAHLPVVSLNQPLGEQGDTLSVDSYAGMREAVGHLVVTHGRRRPACIRGPLANPVSHARYRAYADALAHHRVPHEHGLVCAAVDFTAGAGASAMRVLVEARGLTPGVDFDAVVACSDVLAADALRFLTGRGVRVPEDVAVVGFNDSPEARLCDPPLTSVALPFSELGALAVDTLVARLRGTRPPDRTAVPGALVVRRSCGCPSPLVFHGPAPGGTRRPDARTGTGRTEGTRDDGWGEVCAALPGSGPELAAAFRADMARTADTAGTTADVSGTAGAADAAGTESAADILDTAHPAGGAEPGAGRAEGPDAGPPTGAFLPLVERLLSARAGTLAEAARWQEALASARAQVVAAQPAARRGHAELLLGQARLMVAEKARRLVEYERWAQGRQAQRLRDLGTALTTVVDLEGLGDVLERHTSAAGMPGCRLVLHEDAWARAETAGAAGATGTTTGVETAGAAVRGMARPLLTRDERRGGGRPGPPAGQASPDGSTSSTDSMSPDRSTSSTGPTSPDGSTSSTGSASPKGSASPTGSAFPVGAKLPMDSAFPIDSAFPTGPPPPVGPGSPVGPSSPVGPAFPAALLLPDALMPRGGRFALVLEPLHIGEEHLGFAVFDATSARGAQRDGALYRALGDQISAALKALGLFDEVRRARDAAEQASRFKTRLLASVTDELRPPVEALLRHAEGGDPADALAVVRRDAGRLLHLIDNLLDLSRSEADDLVPARRLLDPLPALAAAFRTAAAARRAADGWSLDLPARLPALSADETRLRQIVGNLLAAAAAGSPDGGRVALAARLRPASVRVTVTARDDGPPPRPGAGERRPAGTEIGVAAAHRLAMLHGGSLIADHGPRGVRFLLDLPLPSPGGPARPAAQQHGTLLVVSARDEPPADVRDFAERHGLRPHRLGAADDVAAAVERHPPAAVVWDARAARPEEWPAVQRLHDRPELRHTPFLLFGAAGPDLAGTLRALRPGGLAAPVVAVAASERSRESLRRLVEAALPGHPSRVAADGTTALALVAEEAPRLIVLERSLPDMHALDVVDRVHDGTGRALCPVVVTSHHGFTAADARRARPHPSLLLLDLDVFTPEEAAALVVRLAEDARTVSSRARAPVHDALVFLHEHYRRQISRWQVAQAAGVSADHLGKLFHRQFGLTVWEYLTRLRIRRAAERLRAGGDSIQSVARSVGFRDRAYFSRVFRRVTGVAPHAYREEAVRGGAAAGR